MTVEGQTAEQPDWSEHQRLALFAGAGGVAILVVIACFDFSLGTNTALHAYLVAYLFWLGVGLGSLALLMVQHLSGGAWGLIIRRVLEAATRTLPLLAVMFVPLLFGLDKLYEWANVHEVAEDALLQHKRSYLNVSFFLLRAAAYFAVWIVAALLLNFWSRRQDERADARISDKLRTVSGPGLLVYGLTITFAAVDWAMSLEPHWFSTIYGVLFGIGQILSAFAMAIVVVTALATKEPFAGVVSKSHFRDLGSLLLAFVMLWTYVSLSQFLLIWSGNLPEETPWYLRRTGGGWEVIAVALMLGHFAMPFLLLLSRSLKQTPTALRIVAIGLLVMRAVDMCWLIIPAFSEWSPGDVPAFSWVDVLSSVVAVVGVGGVWLWVFMHELKRWPLLPVNDPEYAEATQHE